MLRPFILMLANRKRFPDANHAGAEALAEFLLKPATQEFIGNFRSQVTAGRPCFFPIAKEAQETD